MFRLQYLLTAQVVPRTFDLAGMLAVQSPALTEQKKSECPELLPSASSARAVHSLHNRMPSSHLVGV